MKNFPVSVEVKEENPTANPDELILIDAKQRFQQAQSHWMDFHKEAEDCLLYLGDGDYMDSRYTAARQSAGLPILNENHVRPALEHNVNEFKQSVPAIQVESASDDTNPEFAEQMADMIRTIERDSNAKTHYGTAGWYCIGTGLGFVRVCNEDVPNEFSQQLCIKPIANPFTVFMDPAHIDPTGSDCEFIFIVDSLTVDEYLRKYGSSTMATDMSAARTSAQGWSEYTAKQQGNQWLTPNTVLVAEYWMREHSTEMLYEYWDKEIGAAKTTTDLDVVAGREITNSREQEVHTIKQFILNDKEILDRNEWPGKSIPVIAFKGMEYWNKSKRHLSGIIQAMRAPQKRIDYTLNWQLEMLMMMPKAPYVGTDKNFENNENEWADINASNQAFVTYNPDNRNSGEKPSRDILGFDIAASQTILANSVEGVKAVTGMQAPMTGENSNEQGPESGKAQLTRVQQSQMTRFTEQFNIQNAIAQVGKVIMEAAPAYLKENGRRLIGTRKNGQQYLITLNTDVSNMLKDKQFKVAVETGGTYLTKRQEAADKSMTLMTILPQQASSFADIAVENQDWPGAKEIAARLRALVPPQVLAATQEMDKQEGPQVIANLKSQNGQLTQQLQQIQQEVQPDKIKLQKAEMETAFARHDKTWELEKIKVEREIDMEKLRIEEQKIILEAEIKRRELDQEDRALDLKERELGLKANVAQHGIASDAMEHSHKVHERIAIDIPNLDENKLDNVGQQAKTGSEGDLS